MEDVIIKQFYFGFIVYDEDWIIFMEVLLVLEDKFNGEVDLLSLDMLLCKLYIMVDFIVIKEELVFFIKEENVVLEVEVLLSWEGWIDVEGFEEVL